MKRWGLTFPAAHTQVSNSDKALKIFPSPSHPKMPAGSPSVAVDQSPALPLSPPAAGLPGFGVFRQGSFSVMPRWVVGAGVVGAALVVTISKNG